MASRAPINAASDPRPFRAEDLQRLLEVAESPCVSIYLSTHRRFPEWKQDPVRYRALLAHAEAEVAKRSPGREPDGVLDLARRLLDGPHWEYALDGLGIFCSTSFSVAYRLPTPVPDSVVVSDSFHTKPLFRFIRGNVRYYVLALSQNAVSLYEGSSFGASAMDLAGLPTDLTDALGASELDEHERGVVVHGGGAAGRSFHGRGPGKEERKEDLLKYFRAIDKALHAYLKNERAPLLLAAVHYYLPMYREANTYPHLLEKGLDGNYERVNGEKIHADAWPIVSHAFERQAVEWVDRYRSLEGKGLALDRLEAVALATVEGRVRCLLAAEDAKLSGRFDRATGSVARREPTDPDDGDLIDDISEEAWKRGAEILVLRRDMLPTSSPIAAVLRF
jgi:hypothetical protein